MTTSKLYGCVRYLGQRFHPEIVAVSDRAEDVLWRGHSCWDVHTAREVLAEAVALIGLCFWPPDGLNDNGRELGLSPWTLQAIKAACELVGTALIDAECRNLEALLARGGGTPAVTRPRCTRCGNEIDPDCCWCGGKIDAHTMSDGHAPIPWGCDCGRVEAPR